MSKDTEKVFMVSFWCLYDKDADKKYFKKSLTDGSLAIFDEEHEAVNAKCLRDGHMRVDYVKASDYGSVREDRDSFQRVGIKAIEQRDQLARLLSEVCDAYEAAIHWEDLREIIRKSKELLEKSEQ